MSRRNCPACGTPFIRGKRVLLVTSGAAASKVVCQGCAKLSKRSPQLALDLRCLEERVTETIACPPVVERVDDVDARVLRFARELDGGGR